VTEPSVALADPVRLRQIVRNLLDNAIKCTPAGGSVGVRASPAHDAVEVSVADTGVGIPPDRLDDIFEAFVQVERSADGGGSGLGLAICRRLAEAMGGSLRVSSAPGEGSEFVVTLPAAD
jgi:signal transduction histidine kinase